MAYCTPFGYRVVRRQAPIPAPAFFPSAVQADFSPLLRLFGDLDSLTSSNRPAKGRNVRPFQPRFDVREEQDAYHLQGELPGIDQKDIEIEFTEPTTLVVRGRTVREHSTGNASTQPEQDKAVEQQQQQQQEETAPTPEVEQAQSDTVSESGSNYHRPSVEEERDEDWTDAAPEVNTPATTTTAAAVAETAQPAEAKHPEQLVSKQTEAQQQKTQAQSGRYWVSERSVGQFQRTFSFNGQIDQEGVTASLKNGILSIVVPKLQTKLRKISIE